MLAVSLAAPPATAAVSEKPAGESVFKGHRLTTFLDEATRRARIELDGREVAAKDGVAELGKPNSFDLISSFLYVIRVKTTANCASFFIVRVAVEIDPGKSEVLSDFGACNHMLTIQTTHRQGWAAWSAVAYRDDLATAHLAFIQDEKLVTHEVKALPCLFVAAAQADCVQGLIADAAGYGELGVPTGAGAFADHKVRTFLNRSSGKATIELNGRVFRTFDDVKEFYLAAVDGEDQFGLFSFFLKKDKECATRPLLFFPTRTSAPEVVMDFGKCSDQMTRLTRKKVNAIEWSGIAYHQGDPQGYIASVIDHKLSTRSVLLPGCMLEADKAKTQNCVLQALGEQAPSQPPQLRVIPPPAPRTGPKPPRTLGI